MPKQKKIIIAGAGPAGLVAALEALKKGYQVLVLEKRSHLDPANKVSALRSYIRPQPMILSFKSLNYLRKTIGFSKLRKGLIRFLPPMMQVKDIERAWFEALSQAETNGQLTISKAEFTGIDKEQTQACYKENGKQKSSTFDYLICATGTGFAGSEVSRQLKVEYEVIETAESPDQFTASITIDPTIQLVQPRGESNNHYEMKLFFYKEGHKAYILGELPESIAKIQDSEVRRQQIQVWVASQVKLEYGIQAGAISIKESRKHGAKKTRLKAINFKVEIKKISNLVAGDSKNIFILGDAARSPNPYLGHGFNDAVLYGTTFGQALPENGDANSTFNTTLLTEIFTKRNQELDSLQKKRDRSKTSPNFLDKVMLALNWLIKYLRADKEFIDPTVMSSRIQASNANDTNTEKRHIEYIDGKKQTGHIEVAANSAVPAVSPGTEKQTNSADCVKRKNSRSRSDGDTLSHRGITFFDRSNSSSQAQGMNSRPQNGPQTESLNSRPKVV